jgi:hypothetical protein
MVIEAKIRCPGSAREVGVVFAEYAKMLGKRA